MTNQLVMTKSKFGVFFVKLRCYQLEMIFTSHSPLASIPFGVSVFLPKNEALTRLNNWQEFLPPKIRSAHSNRQADWITSRIALQDAFTNVGINLSIRDLQDATHHASTLAPNWIFSLSHCDTGALVWVVPMDPKVMIGVDVEISSREISDAVKSRFVTERDLTMTPLKLWSLKEACYKSLPEEIQKITTFASIEISENKFRVSNKAVGKWSQVEKDNTVFSFAYRQN